MIINQLILKKVINHQNIRKININHTENKKKTESQIADLSNNLGKFAELTGIATPS